MSQEYQTTMNTLIHSLFRSLETCIHERLVMMEELISGMVKAKEEGGGDKKTEELMRQVLDLEERIRLLEKTPTSPAMATPTNVWIDALKDLEIVLPTASTVEQPTYVNIEKKAVVEEEDEEVVEEEVVEEEEEEVVEEEVVEEEEEEVVELEEITFKGKTYCKDADNNIYDSAGEDIIGTWDVTRQRVLFKRSL
jgi:hypothetical protein